ncbi:hypothetical protein BBF96_01435 [Anoxybacter fermentans]|uniref:Uncharacterized protein n=1 Tax=Anoxybacter fermentans TaxID=1323375 RepID=A0A3S9SV30_9FIRM|nr:hypothetical protein BBF96_01435 [Anoxybacter fermentans]
MIRKFYFGGNRALDDSKNFSRSEKLAFCSLTIYIFSMNRIGKLFQYRKCKKKTVQEVGERTKINVGAVIY